RIYIILYNTIYLAVSRLNYLGLFIILQINYAVFTLERITGYPKSSIVFSIASIVVDSESKFNLTLLELNKTSRLSFSIPSIPLTAFSIFCIHEGQVNVSRLITAFCIVNLSF